MTGSTGTTLAAIGAMALISACGSARASDAQWQASTYHAGEPQITGSGRVISQAFPIGRFDTLAIDGPVDVDVRQGAARSLVIYADDNLMPLVRATTQHGTLALATKGSFRSREGIRAVLTVPALDRVEINASGDVRIESWEARAIALVIGGSGDIDLTGRVGAIRALIRGSGDIDLSQVRAAHVDADIEGSGTIHAGSPGKLDATIDGSGRILADRVGQLDAVLNGSGEILYRSADRVARAQRNGAGRIDRR